MTKGDWCCFERRLLLLSLFILYFTISSLLFPRLSLSLSNSLFLQILASPRISDSRPSVLFPTMATGNKGRPLPKFGEWDASNPASAEGFTVIFNKARDDKKTKKTAVAGPESLVTPPRNDESHQNSNHNKRNSQTPRAKKRWLCFCKQNH